jgi:hypothetical protein
VHVAARVRLDEIGVGNHCVAQLRERGTRVCQRRRRAQQVGGRPDALAGIAKFLRAFRNQRRVALDSFRRVRRQLRLNTEVRIEQRQHGIAGARDAACGNEQSQDEEHT